MYGSAVIGYIDHIQDYEELSISDKIVDWFANVYVA
jgi:hypothetical protein